MTKLSDRKDFYLYKRPDKEDETRKRLDEIQELGLTEVGIAQFGIEGLMSGLYIERVWNMTDDQWNDYMNWIKELKQQKSSQKNKLNHE